MNPIKKGQGSAQGGNIYLYGSASDVDSPGEYFIDRLGLKLSFIPPALRKLTNPHQGSLHSPSIQPSPTAQQGQYHISRLDSVVVAAGVSAVAFRNLEIRYARGGGVIINDSTDVMLDSCTISNHGQMGVNITGGKRCGVRSCNIAGNGDVGVAMMGGNRQNLEPSNHFVNDSTIHHNQRWILNYAPDIFMGGVGQVASGNEIYGSPQIAVFMQGNDHTLARSHIHDAARQCSDVSLLHSL